MTRFKETTGNLWDYVSKGNVIVITTNGLVNDRGNAIMGAGVAKQAKLQYPAVPKRLGALLQQHGLCVEALPMGGIDATGEPEWTLVAFPTKVDWRDPSSLDLIARSAAQLEAMATRNRWQHVYLCEPGTGKGGLSWEQVVESGVLDCLDERFTVVHR